MGKTIPIFIAAVFFISSLNAQNRHFDPEVIDIVRDSIGVPHIFAKTDAEVAYGLAWATMEDNVDNAQFMICAMRGLLGRHQGLDGAKIDFAVQFMGVMEYVDEHYEAKIPEDYKRVLEGYAAGANAYIKKHPEHVWFKKAFPVRPQDLVAGHMLAMALMGGVEGTITRMVDGRIVNEIPKEEDGIGSNAFAFNSAKTEHGNTFLAVNAHQPIEGLLSWYEAHLCSEEGWNIVGALFHGSPQILLGSNENLGWAHTTGQLDEKDVFQLEMHKRKNRRYKVDDEWLKLEKHGAKIRVGMGKNKRFIFPWRKRFWTSIYGPTLKIKEGTFALGMPALFDINPALQWYRMNKARNFTEFKKALELQGLSRQNITYADKNDTIYFISNGVIPKRNVNYKWKGVVPGNTRETLWSEYLPIDSLSWFLNPSCGYVFNVNNAGFEATAREENHKLTDFHPHIGYREEFNNRSLRFYELMENDYAGKKIDYEDFKLIKFDHQYPEDLTFRGDFSLIPMRRMNPSSYPDIANAIKRIKDFDLRADTADRNYPIFMFTIYELLAENGDHLRETSANPEAMEKIFAECIRRAQQHMIDHFGTIDKSTGQVQVIEREGKSCGVAGGPDAIRAVFGNKLDDGRIKMRAGDGYIQLTKFTKDGPTIESINALGASTYPESPHFTDQMEPFSKHQLRRVSLDKEEVYKTALSIYHPE